MKKQKNISPVVKAANDASFKKLLPLPLHNIFVKGFLMGAKWKSNESFNQKVKALKKDIESDLK